MVSAFLNIFKIPDLRQRILFTLAMLVIVRVGYQITLPGVDPGILKLWIDSAPKTGDSPFAQATALLNVFSGGGLQRCAIFALGIMPYISASIMMQLLTAVVPSMSKLAREDGGRQKINQYPAPWGAESLKKEMSAYEGSKGTIKFPLDRPMPLALIKKMVKYRMRQNEAKAGLKKSIVK
jgi:hypothetical protein